MIKNECQTGNVFNNFSNHHQRAGITESDLWVLGTNRMICSRVCPTSSLCVTERNKTNSGQVSDIFNIFMFPSPFITLIAMKLQMLQNAVDERKTRDFSVL